MHATIITYQIYTHTYICFGSLYQNAAHLHVFFAASEPTSHSFGILPHCLFDMRDTKWESELPCKDDNAGSHVSTYIEQYMMLD